MSGGNLSLNDAASALGVHYQTAYQWVRSGELPAVRVGRRYVIDPSDLAVFQAHRDAGRPPQPVRARNDFATALPRFEAALIAGDEAALRRITDRYVSTGTSLTSVIVGLFAPAMRQIGADWACGNSTIAIEHRATAMIQRLIAENLPRKRGRPRGEVIVAMPSGEHHELAAVMATAALREAGWKVHHFGADMPTTEIATFAAEHPVDLVVLTTTTEQAREAAVAAIAELAVHDVPAVTNAPGMSLTELVSVAEAKRNR